MPSEFQMSSLASLRCREIIESDWSSILRIQSEVYYDFTPESGSVMRSKAVHGPRTSFVAVSQDDAVVAYCLAHPYPRNQTAILGVAALGTIEPSDNLFLHDFAVQPSSSGRGVAKLLFEHLTSIAIAAGYQSISLVAVQKAAGFWSKMGFASSTLAPIDKSFTGDATFMTKSLPMLSSSA